VTDHVSFKSAGNIALVLGALTAGGGITGYARTGSVPSIAAGVTVGLLVRRDSDARSFPGQQLTLQQYILGGLRINNRNPYGVELALLASVVLAGSSIPRAVKSGKPLPILLSVLATFGLWTYGSAFASRSSV